MQNTIHSHITNKRKQRNSILKPSFSSNTIDYRIHKLFYNLLEIKYFHSIDRRWSKYWEVHSIILSTMLHRPLTFPKYASYILIMVAVSFNISLNLLVINELYMTKRWQKWQENENWWFSVNLHINLSSFTLVFFLHLCNH